MGGATAPGRGVGISSGAEPEAIGTGSAMDFASGIGPGKEMSDGTTVGTGVGPSASFIPGTVAIDGDVAISGC